MGGSSGWWQSPSSSLLSENRIGASRRGGRSPAALSRSSRGNELDGINRSFGLPGSRYNSASHSDAGRHRVVLSPLSRLEEHRRRGSCNHRDCLSLLRHRLRRPSHERRSNRTPHEHTVPSTGRKELKRQTYKGTHRQRNQRHSSVVGWKLGL